MLCTAHLQGASFITWTLSTAHLEMQSAQPYPAALVVTHTVFYVIGLPTHSLLCHWATEEQRANPSVQVPTH